MPFVSKNSSCLSGLGCGSSPQSMAALALATRKTAVSRPAQMRLGNYVMRNLAHTAAGKSSVFRARGLGDVTCSIDPTTGGRVCTNDPGTGAAASPAAQFPDGTLIRGTGPEIDRMENGTRRWIPDPTTFQCMGLNYGDVHNIPQSQFLAIPQGPAYPVLNAGSCSQFAPSPLVAPAVAPFTPTPGIDPYTGQPLVSSALPAPLVSTAPAMAPAISTPTNWTKIALIGGGVLVGGLVLKKVLK